MYLSDNDIRKGVKNGDIIIDKFNESQLQPASYDIRLRNKFIYNLEHETSFVDPVKKIFPKVREVFIKDSEEFILHPGVSVLATSVELFGSEKYLIHLNGKSSLARIGLVVHNTAGLINPGHYLHITFELANLSNIPIVLHPQMPIAQLTFSMLSSPPGKEYAKVGRYGNGMKNVSSYIPPKVVRLSKKKARTK